MRRLSRPFLNQVWLHLERVERALEVDPAGAKEQVLDWVIKELKRARKIVAKSITSGSLIEVVALVDEMNGRCSRLLDQLVSLNDDSEVRDRKICRIARELHVFCGILAVTDEDEQKVLTLIEGTAQKLAEAMDTAVAARGSEAGVKLYRRNVRYRIESLKCFPALVEGNEPAFIVGALLASGALF